MIRCSNETTKIHKELFRSINDWLRDLTENIHCIMKLITVCRYKTFHNKIIDSYSRTLLSLVVFKGVTQKEGVSVSVYPTKMLIFVYIFPPLIITQFPIYFAYCTLVHRIKIIIHELCCWLTISICNLYGRISFVVVEF